MVDEVVVTRKKNTDMPQITDKLCHMMLYRDLCEEE